MLPLSSSRSCTSGRYTHMQWKKTIVIVEGIYCMEGEICNLPEIMVVCKKYKV
jgi:serine palmitoyltransferase